MEILWAAMLISLVLTKMWFTYRVEHEYAKKGKDSPRFKWKMAQFQAGKAAAPPKRPGASGYFRDLWDDIWDDATERRRKHREEKKAGTRPRLWERVKRGWQWTQSAFQGREGNETKGGASATPEPTVDDGLKPATPAADGPNLFACAECGAGMEGPGNCPSCGASYPAPARGPDMFPTPAPLPRSQNPAWNHPTPQIGTYQPRHDGAQQPTINGGTNTMSPTGEATNYEQAIVEIQRMRSHLTGMQDQVAALKQHLTGANNCVDALDAGRTALGAATDQYKASLEQQNVDSATVGHAGEVADALSPNSICRLIEHIDGALAELGAFVSAIDNAQSSAASTEKSLTEKYADIVDRMAQTGVKGSFVEKS